jgi:prephenate dehydratase
MLTNTNNQPAVSVAFQGEKGAYSEEAILKIFGEHASTLPCYAFNGVLEQLTNRQVDYAILPIENALAGTVAHAFDELLKNEIYIWQEIVLKVNHCLLTLPEASFNTLKDVYSHPQALAQCYNQITRFNLNAHSYHDTAGSAQYIKQRQNLSEGAIASACAGKTYGLKILKPHFEDETFNYTRFFLLANTPNHKRQANQAYKTTVIFATQHKPHALVKVLNALSNHHLNMTKIESRPSKNRAWEYYFFVDFMGHQDNSNVQAALNEMTSHTVFFKILGSYVTFQFLE